MHQILIVDDNAIERQGLAFLIHKYEMPLAVHQCANGKEALAYLREHPVDILLSDIRMPLMDGVSLIEEVARNFEQVICVVISGYGDFDYAQRVMKCGVQHYLLKPVDLSEFAAVMESVIDTLKRIEQNQQRSEALLQGERLFAQQRRQMHFARALLNKKSVAGDFDAAGLLPRPHHFHLVRLAFEGSFFDRHDERFEEILKRHLGDSYISLIMNESEGLVLVAQDEKPCMDKVQDIAAALRDLAGAHCTVKISPSFPSLNELYDVWKGMQAEDEEADPPDGPIGAEQLTLIDRVKEYIAKHYARDIGLEEIARQVFLSPGYLSQLFKSVAKQSLIKYITAYRLERARELLSDESLRVQEVGRLVGYPNPSYFSIVFRNNTGMTPAEYRRRQGI